MRLACIGVAVPVLAFSILTVASGCLTAPPPDLPEVRHRPTILPDEVPSIDVPLRHWPGDGQFIVEVQVDPGTSFIWAAFFDYNPSATTVQRNDPGNPFGYPGAAIAAPSNGMPANVSFQLRPEMRMDDGLCHRIDLIVTDAFSPNGTPSSPPYFHTPSPAGLGADVVTWWYTGDMDLASCSPYGGALPDGGYPSPDAPPDSPPLVPE